MFSYQLCVMRKEIREGIHESYFALFEYLIQSKLIFVYHSLPFFMLFHFFLISAQESSFWGLNCFWISFWLQIFNLKFVSVLWWYSRKGQVIKRAKVIPFIVWQLTCHTLHYINTCHHWPRISKRWQMYVRMQWKSSWSEFFPVPLIVHWWLRENF